MNDKVIIRKTKQEDLPLLQKLYKNAFADEDLFPLVYDLFNEKLNITMFTAISNDIVVGHIAFTKCYTDISDTSIALLGPLAVLPDYQGQSIGASLITTGFNYLQEKQVMKVLVLGDPNYYQRFAFKEEQAILPAYKIPKEWKTAWQSVCLITSPICPSRKLQVPEPWQKAELWSA